MPKHAFDCPVHQVTRVVDGDTQKLLLDLGFSTYMSITTRVAGIDCPEKSTEAGRLVTAVVSQWLRAVSVSKFQLRWVSGEVDMYGRSLGDFYDIERPDNRLSAYLLGNRLAKPYSERRSQWTFEELSIAVKNCVLLME